MADRRDAVRTRPSSRDVQYRKDELDHRETHEEDDEMPPSTEDDRECHREESRDREAPPRAARVEVVRPRVRPGGPGRCDEPDDRRIEVIEWVRREVQPDHARDDDDEYRTEPELARQADRLRQRRWGARRAAMPPSLWNDDDVIRWSAGLRGAVSRR